MTEGKGGYCGQCGNPILSGDKFCGSCGAVVTSVTPEYPQVIPEPVAAQTAPARSNRTFLIAGVVCILLVLLVGGGALALVGLGSGAGLFGGSEPEPIPSTDTQEPTLPDESTEDPKVDTVPSDAPPDPAFDSLLPTLQEMTDAPIMLPAELPDDMDIVAIDGYLTDDEQKYGIVFTYGPTEVVAEPPNAQILGTLSAYPEDEDVANEYFDAERVQDVKLSDDTSATLRYMVPAGRAGSQGPFWEGKFDKAGYTYRLMVTKTQDITKDEIQQVLSTMVEVRGALTSEGTQESTELNEPESTTPLGDDFVGDAEEAAEEYYQASGMEDWEYTYEHLDSETQSLFTEEEWSQKNQWYADNGEVIYRIDSVDQVGTSTDYLGVTLTFTGEDGSSTTRTTYFILEDGEWLHHFSQEEIDLLMPDLSYEEFVEANQ